EPQAVRRGNSHNVMSLLKKLFGRHRPDSGETTTHLIYIKIPAPIGPAERAERFEDPLEESLQRNGLGEVSGGGSLLSQPDADGKRSIEYCGIDVDVRDLAVGLGFLKAEMRRLQAPAGTSLEFQTQGTWHSIGIYDSTQ